MSHHRSKYTNYQKPTGEITIALIPGSRLATGRIVGKPYLIGLRRSCLLFGQDDCWRQAAHESRG